MQAILTPTTTDKTIRTVLGSFVRQEHPFAPEPLYVEEFALFGGQTRADVAFFCNLSHGYEIKGESDTLARLPGQVDAYNAVFERATLVSAPCHLTDAAAMIPDWWGIIKAEWTSGSVVLTRIRESRPNPEPKSDAIAALLWRGEALRLLASLGLDTGVRTKPVSALVDRLAESVAPDRLAEYVRQALRARGDWRFAARQKQCGGRSPRRASWWDSRRTLYARRPR